MIGAAAGLLHVQRLKNGIDSVHPLEWPLVEALDVALRKPLSPRLAHRYGSQCATAVTKLVSIRARWLRIGAGD